MSHYIQRTVNVDKKKTVKNYRMFVIWPKSNISNRFLVSDE